MKKYKIEFQSFSDVITNSSSTVFLVEHDIFEDVQKWQPRNNVYAVELTWDNICPEDLLAIPEENFDNMYPCKNPAINTSKDCSKYVFKLLENVKDANLIIKNPSWYFAERDDYYFVNPHEYYKFCQDNKEIIEKYVVGRVIMDVDRNEDYDIWRALQLNNIYEEDD